MSATNPDTRPLPTGWISQYDDNYKAWFYVDTAANPPTPSWTHPLGPPPATPSHTDPHPPQRQDSYGGAHLSGGNSHAAAAPHDAAAAASIEPKNPDTRPLPLGWISQYDPGHKAWFYVDTNASSPTPSWAHPLGPPPTSPSGTSNAPTSPTPNSITQTPASAPAPAPTKPNEPENPDKRPLPAGWIQQYDTNHSAFFYVDTTAPNPIPSWTHPLGPPPTSPGPQGGATHSPAPVNTKDTSAPPQQPTPGQPENPDKRPLPTGWIQQYDPNHKAYFYVDTTASNPSPSWTHPLGPPPTSPGPHGGATSSPAPAPAHSRTASLPPQPATPGQPENPDKRPLPTGWIQQYDSNYKAYFYVDTTALNPTPSWTHPLGPPPTSPGPHGGVTHSPTPPSTKATSPPPQPTIPGQPENPDKRPLPTGWIQQYDTNNKAYFYVDTTAPNPAPTWIHPLGPPPTSPKPNSISNASSGSTPALPKPATLGQPENPDKRPLPTGWIDQYDPNHKAWFYVDTKAPTPAPTWTHPLGPPPTSPGPHGGVIAPSIPQPSSVHAPAPAPTSGPQNPDTRPLPPGWVQQHDPNHNTWFYVDTTKSPPVTTWTHPAGPPPPGGHSATPTSSGYGAPAPHTPYGQQPVYGQQPAYGQQPYGGSHQKPNKDPISNLLGSSAGKMVGGLLGGKAGKMAGKFLAGSNKMPGQGQSSPYGGSAPPGQAPYQQPGYGAPPQPGYGQQQPHGHGW